MRVKNRLSVLVLLMCCALFACQCSQLETASTRERILFNEDWKFYKYESVEQADSLIYDIRPAIGEVMDNKDADSRPTAPVQMETKQIVLKPWVLPTANKFIKDDANKHRRPHGNPGSDFAFVQADFDDSSWERVDLPQDWAIKGPFQVGWNSEVGGGMGRLPCNGVAWYRKKFLVPQSDHGKSIFLDIDGAMSYAMVWLNGSLIGGWPYGYNSWRLDLSDYLRFGEENQLAIRVDNPNHSARWYSGGGIYRNVWLTKTNKIHVGQWGTYITTSQVSEEKANVHVEVTIDNDLLENVSVACVTEIYPVDCNKQEVVPIGLLLQKVKIKGKQSATIKESVIIDHPQLWNPLPKGEAHLYQAITTVMQNGKILDVYETNFGIRKIEFDADTGVLINGEYIKLKGVNQHHDLGALGAAFNSRAAERQLEILRDMGCNAIRMAHNPPAPELLDLADRMGFVVIDEIFDSWEKKKTPHDFHLIFPECRSLMLALLFEEIEIILQ